MTKQYLRVVHVAALCGNVGKATVYRWLAADPAFPRPFNLSEGVMVWDRDDIVAWVEAKRAAARAKEST